MRGPLRGYALAFACVAAALLIGIAAILDHRDKQRRITQAQIDAYYCRHVGTRCGGVPWQRIEEHWQTRQWIYEVAVVTLGGLGLVLLVRTALSRRAVV
jgi:hypothetical protein